MSASGRASFYESRPDLTDEQILETWDGIGGSRAADRETDDPVILWFQVKAKMRVLSMVLGFEPQREPSWRLRCMASPMRIRGGSHAQEQVQHTFEQFFYQCAGHQLDDPINEWQSGMNLTLRNPAVKGQVSE